MSRLFLTATLLASLATPALADEVNVYSYRQTFLTDPIFDAFTAETGIKVNTVFAKKGLIERLEAEGANSPADILLLSDIGNLDAAVSAGVSQAVSSDVLEANIPAKDRDPDGHWFGLTNRARVVVVNTEQVDANAVQTYASLADPALEGRLCTRSGKHGYMVALIASRIAHVGEAQASEWLSGVKNNLARKPQGGDRDQVKAVAQGQCDVALLNSYYIGAMLSDDEQKTWMDGLEIVFPDQDGAGTHMNVSGVLLTAASPNKDNAVKLMEFLSGDTAQGLYADVNHEYPVNNNVAWSAVVSKWGEFRQDTTPLADIATHRKAASRLVDIVDYDG